jgi:hypothetical protein
METWELAWFPVARGSALGTPSRRGKLGLSRQAVQSRSPGCQAVTVRLSKTGYYLADNICVIMLSWRWPEFKGKVNRPRVRFPNWECLAKSPAQAVKSLFSNS